MGIVYGPNVGLMAGAADGDLYGDAMRAFQRGVDSFLMPTVDGYLINTPPASPVEGSFYIIGAAPSGDWAGHAGEMARWSSHVSAWEFFTPKNGWMVQANSARESYRYTDGDWEIFYKEGTFTPSLGFSSGSVTYSEQLGRYTRIGRHVHAVVRLVISGVSSPSGALSITGLPEKSKEDGIWPPSTLSVGSIAGVSSVWASVVPGVAYAYLYGHAPSSAYAILYAASLQTGSEISASISYEV